jgi:hypothetical protein
VCSEIGALFIHSLYVSGGFSWIRFRVLVRLSQIIHRNRSMDSKDNREPREEIEFHVEKASG